MGKEFLIFGDIKILKNKFYRQKIPNFEKVVDIEKVLDLSIKIFAGEKNYKYFIGYLHNDHKVKPLHIMLAKVSTHVKIYDGQTKWKYFLIGDNGLLEKSNTTWNNVSVDIKKEFDSEQLLTWILHLEKDDNYYLPKFLKECIYVEN